MSAGVFSIARYQGDATTFVQAVRVQPETVSATVGPIANAAATAAVTVPGFLKVSAGRKTKQLRPRKVTATLAGTAPTGYKPGTTCRIIALTPAFFAACTIGATLTYLGTTWTISGRSAELS